MKRFFKALLRSSGLQISRDFRILKLFRKNVFKTNYQRHALIIYITRPFIGKMDYRHTNYLECYTAAEILSKFRYNIDVIDCNINQKINFEKYDVIYGMGSMMEKAFFQKLKNKVCTIFYGTGLNPIVWNAKTTLRIRDFRERHGILLWDSSRLIPHPVNAQVLLSNAVVALGDSYNFNDYIETDKRGASRYHQIQSFYYDCYDIDLNKKNFNLARKNFIWFGSHGAIHKGLDILLDIFSVMKDVNLHICGINPYESDFQSYFSNLLSKHENIINHGFVNLRSEQFRTLMDQCGFVILPSCAEGGSPSVLNCAANGGLVPIISKDCGLDIDEYGWVLDYPDIKLFTDAINHVKESSSEDLKSKSVRIKEYVRSFYTYDRYQQCLKKILLNILEKDDKL